MTLEPFNHLRGPSFLEFWKDYPRTGEPIVEEPAHSQYFSSHHEIAGEVAKIVEAAFPAPLVWSQHFPRTLYQELVNAGCEIDNHESDLHVKECDEAMTIIFRHFFSAGSTMKIPSKFVSNIDGSTWWDIPFAYDPFWDRQA
jgi:hypothetical protein